MSQDPSQGRDRKQPPTSAECDVLRTRLARIAARICPPAMALQPDDIAQGALLRILPHARSGEANCGLSESYLAAAASSALTDLIRARTRRRRTEVSGVMDVAALTHAAAGAEPDSLFASAQIGERIRQCLAELPEDRRAAVGLYLEGHALAEIASELGCPLKTAENLVYRGRRELQKRLVALGIEP